MNEPKVSSNYGRRIAEAALIVLVMFSMLYTASEFLGMDWLKWPFQQLVGAFR